VRRQVPLIARIRHIRDCRRRLDTLTSPSMRSTSTPASSYFGPASTPQRRKGRLRPNPCNGLPCSGAPSPQSGRPRHLAPTIRGMTAVDRPTISGQFLGQFHAHFRGTFRTRSCCCARRRRLRRLLRPTPRRRRPAACQPDPRQDPTALPATTFAPFTSAGLMELHFDKRAAAGA
jgi:hypothetical protein